jgi:hypothetical protein
VPGEEGSWEESEKLATTTSAVGVKISAPQLLIAEAFQELHF